MNMQLSGVLAVILSLAVSSRLFVEADTGDKTGKESTTQAKPKGDAKLANTADKTEESRPDQPAYIDPAEAERDREAGFIIDKIKTVTDCTRYAKVGDTVYIHYTGKLAATGVKFDSSRDNKGLPFKFLVGSGEVIPGWDKGVINMCVGEKRLLIIPPHMGYGTQSMGNVIPGNSTLKFQIEMMDIKDLKESKNVFREVDVNMDNQLSKEEVSSYLTHREIGEREDTEQDQAGHDGMLAEIFAKEDKNKDGFISYEEFSGPKHDEL